MEKNKQDLKTKLLPLILSVAVIILDQLSKFLVVRFIPRLSFPYTEGIIPVLGDALRLIHVRNNAVAFSLGSSLPQNVRSVLFAFLPLIVIVLVYIIYFRNNDFTNLQRWSICGILGGGIGNLIDRFLRPEGVVDFIDCVFFGSIKGVSWPVKGPLKWLSWERWPTFNVADSAVVVCGILFIISFIMQVASDSRTNAKKETGRD